MEEGGREGGVVCSSSSSSRMEGRISEERQEEEEWEIGREEGVGWVISEEEEEDLTILQPFLPPFLPLLLSITWLGPVSRFCTSLRAAAAAAAA